MKYVQERISTHKTNSYESVCTIVAAKKGTHDENIFVHKIAWAMEMRKSEMHLANRCADLCTFDDMLTTCVHNT